MDQQIKDAYFAWTASPERAGILDHSLDVKMLDGKSFEEAVIEILREAGRLPEGHE